MVNDLSWCFSQSKGIKIVEPNSNVAEDYLSEAKRDFSLIDKSEPKWSIIKEYYVCYNSFYSLLVKCGIKCEIHDCTLKLLNLFGFSDDVINKLFYLKKSRVGVQYYLKPSSKDYYDFAKSFFEDCEVKFLELNDLNIKKIRNKLREFMK